ncbi:MAG: NAD(P) transhydrogenase subunit alpha [Rickettsiaceae bacterium]|nr:NAD(P) transhydrogenase subunit alpha [Rickettsiaceae bacterium]
MENNAYSINIIVKKLAALSVEADKIAEKLQKYIDTATQNSANYDHLIHQLTVFSLSCIVGYFVVLRVTPALHTPLMSMTNAISGIIIIGALIIAGFEYTSSASILSLFAIFLASINIFGGFMITKRMLNMFEGK